MKNIRRLSFVIIASFVFALAAFAAPAVKDTFSPAVKAAKVQTASTTTNPIDFTDLRVSVTTETFQLEGKSTYALSTCPATFTPIANTIDRFQPLLQPPIY